MHSGRIVFSQSMDDLPHIVVFGLPKLLANRTPVRSSSRLWWSSRVGQAYFFCIPSLNGIYMISQLEFKGLTFNPFLVILSVVKTTNLTKKREKGK